jgi:hypothetical protein
LSLERVYPQEYTSPRTYGFAPASNTTVFLEVFIYKDAQNLYVKIALLQLPIL